MCLRVGACDSQCVDVDTRISFVGSHPMVPLQIERCSRACHRRDVPRTYDVIVEVGAARRCETPRKAFHVSRASQALLRALTPAFERSKGACSASTLKHPSARRRRWHRKELPPVMQLEDALLVQSRAQEVLKSGNASSQCLPVGTSYKDPLRSSTVSSLRDRLGSMLPQPSFALYGKRESTFQSLPRPTSRASSRASNSSHPDSLALELGLESTIGGHRAFATYNVVRGVKSKNCAQIRKLAQSMSKSMSRCFPREAWDACCIQHPADEQEAWESEDRNAEIEKSLADKKIYITIEDVDTEASLERLAEERQMAELAKECGWSVLDVEEVREYFLQYSTDGRINLGSRHFEELLLRLYSKEPPQVDEVRLFIQNVLSAHRSQHTKLGRSSGSLLSDRAKKSRRQQTASNSMALPSQSSRSSFSSETDDCTANVTFPEFFFALTRWLHRAGNAARSSCSLRRFSVEKGYASNHISMDSDDDIPEGDSEENDGLSDSTELTEKDEDKDLLRHMLASVLSE